MKQIILSKEQRCFLMNLDEPQLYENKQDAYKWWGYGQRLAGFRASDRGTGNVLSRIASIFGRRGDANS